MGYGSQAKAPPKSMPKRKMKVLTEAQKKRLKKHSDHHSKKHMAMMRADFLKGMSFKQAHNKAQKMVGK